MSGRMPWLADVLRNRGLEVVEYAGWQARGRATMNPQGVVCHHTAGVRSDDEGYAKWLADVGRPPAVPPPLCQLFLAQDGRFWVLAAGKANHAGRGGWRGLTGNSSVIGIEAEATGYDEWPQVQYDAYVEGVAALLLHLGRSVDWVCGHKEWAPGRKPDPNFDMNEFRQRVAQAMVPSVPPPDRLTQDEVAWLRSLRANVEAVGSNPSFPRYTIAHVREARRES